MNNFIYKTKSGKLTKQRETELRNAARLELNLSSKTPLTTILEMLDIEEVRFYRFMEDFIDGRITTGLVVDEVTPIELPVSIIYTEPTGYEPWKNIMQEYMGQNITMVLKNNNHEIMEAHEYTIPSEDKAFRKYTGDLWFAKHHWQIDSEMQKFSYDQSGQLVVLLATGIDVDDLDKTIYQIFRDGETNCLLTPIKNWIIEKLDKALSKKSGERYVTLYNKINKLLVQYPNGVPREDLSNISNNLNITLSIELPFQKEPFIIEKPVTKSLTTFKYMNTSFNHVEEIINVSKEIVSTPEEIFNKIKECDDNNTNYYFQMNNTNINTLYVNGEIYRLNTTYLSFITSFENKYNIRGWKINAIQYPELTLFIDNSCHYNCCVDFVEKGIMFNEVAHIDQTACYKNFMKCTYYMGFLTKITDFRVTNKIQGIGIYQITNIKIINKKFKQYNDFLHLYENYNSYPSPSLSFLDSVGTYDIIGGCWGIHGELNMLYTDPTISNITEDVTFMSKDNGVPFYSKYFGACNSINYDKKYYLNATEETAQHIKQTTKCEVLRYGVNLFNKTDDTRKTLTSVKTKKTHAFHLSHITSFILDYAKLNIIEQLMVMPFEKIIRVNSDGVYFQEYTDVILKNNYRVKPSEAYNIHTGLFTSYTNTSNFCSNTIFYNIKYNFGQSRDFYTTELAMGGGGSGKTHYNLVDMGSINILYLAPSWKLARNKQDEYKCRVGTHASLLMCDASNDNFVYANVLLIDEVSMLSNEDKEKIIDFYCNYKLIFCGDIKYQLPFIPIPNKVQTEFNTDKFDNIMHFTTDYRATCSKLKDLKQEIRNLIDTEEILTPDHLLNNLQQIKNIDKIYNIEDMILCQYHRQKNKYTEQFTGKFNIEKYYITKTINKYCCGEIIITNEDLPKECLPEIRHSFTVHSIQGETCHTKLFIHRDIMTLRMFYTAISRAKTYDQIYLIS